MNAPPRATYTVVVDLQVERERAKEFLELLRQNATTSLELEPGCQVFDVCQSPEDVGQFLLYEVYENAQAFQHHLETSHFLAFNRIAEPLTISKAVRTFSRLS